MGLELTKRELEILLMMVRNHVWQGNLAMLRGTLVEVGQIEKKIIDLMKGEQDAEASEGDGAVPESA